MDLRRQMDQIYRDTPLDKIPWNIVEPPAILIEAVKSGRIKPCKAIDLGCGAGNYAVWFARQGFEMTGFDISEQAIKHATELAAAENLDCTFVTADMLGDLPGLPAKFDFAFDWEVLHHIFPEDRSRYMENVYRLLNPGGVYFSVCFSEDDPEFGGEGKIRPTPLGTELYFSSEDELREQFAPYFDILELNTIEIPGKYGPHVAVAAWLKRK